MSESLNMQSSVNSNRNYGIDLLRIVAMLMVCVIHVNLFTGAHREIIPGKEYFYYFGTWTEAVGLIGVNLYAMITGYVCVLGNWRYSRYVRLWMLVAFYTVLLYTLGYVLHATGVLYWPASLLHIAYNSSKMLFGSTYWYFAAYTGLFFVMPFLNKGLRNLSKINFLYLTLALVALMAVVNLWNSAQIYSDGYNMTWLVVLYVVGAYIKLYPPLFLRTAWLILVAFICSIKPLAFVAAGMPSGFGYASLESIVYSIALFIIFTRISKLSTPLRRFISWAAPASFSVYLIHVHPWSWPMLSECMRWLNSALDYPWWIAIVGGFAIYMICTVFDRFRLSFFTLCRVDSISDAVAGFIVKKVSLAINKLAKL